VLHAQCSYYILVLIFSLGGGDLPWRGCIVGACRTSLAAPLYDQWALDFLNCEGMTVKESIMIGTTQCKAALFALLRRARSINDLSVQWRPYTMAPD
jgi:hypothetical protein